MKTEHKVLRIAASAISVLEKLDGLQITQNDRVDLGAARGLLEGVIAGNGYTITGNPGSRKTIQKRRTDHHDQESK